MREIICGPRQTHIKKDFKTKEGFWMKKLLPILAALCLLFAVSPAARADSVPKCARPAERGPSEAFEGPETTPSHTPQPVTPAQTAQQWIRGFLGAADAQGLALAESLTYDPGMRTGQHSYQITIAEASGYDIGLAVFSEDGVAISMCSMRLTSALLRSDELVCAADTMWRAARAMIAASDPTAAQESLDAFCEALCYDLPAALLRGERVDVSDVWQGVRYSLWAGAVEDAYYGDSSDPFDGYIVDFVAQAEPVAAEASSCIMRI